MQLLYSLMAALALLVSSPWWLFRMATSGKYRHGLRERLGLVPARLAAEAGSRSIWLHAVSVGEVLAVGRLASELKRRFPEMPLFISTTTASGQKLARERYGVEKVFYFPIDFTFAIRPYIQRLRPRLVVLAETEFWPNFLHGCHRSGAKIAVVNARISDRSFPGYRRWRGVLQHFLRNVDLFLAQSERDRERLCAIGAPAEKVRVSGNLKFDVEPPPRSALVEQLRAALERGGGGPMVVAGSTVEGEEEVLLEVFKKILEHNPRSVLMMAPRRPERFDDVARLLAAEGMKHWRRSSWNSGDAMSGGIFLLDSIGELAGIYQLATVAFVGGSLAPRGGHNILEPAQFGVPIIVGPHTENFRDIVEIFRQAKAVRVLRSGDRDAAAAELLQTIGDLLQDGNERSALGQRAKAVFASQSGAASRSLEALARLLQTSSQRSDAIVERVR